MKKLSIIFVSLIFIAFPIQSFATSGACSDHGGVDCSAGADPSTGNAVCNDGWVSSVSYSDVDECNTSSQCPLYIDDNLYNQESLELQGMITNEQNEYNSDCNSNQHFSDSSAIDEWANTCEQLSEQMTDTKLRLICLKPVSSDPTLNQMNCENLHGLNSLYNPSNSSCYCSYGYTLNSNGQCSPAQVCPSNSTLNSDNTCDCNDGYVYSSSSKSCITYNQNCQNQLGQNSYGDLNYCHCVEGYIIQNNQCIPAPVSAPAESPITPTTTAPVVAKKQTPVKNLNPIIPKIIPQPTTTTNTIIKKQPYTSVPQIAPQPAPKETPKPNIFNKIMNSVKGFFRKLF